MAALDSLTANYTDSEEEDDAKEDATEGKDSTAPSSNADEASNLSAKSASRDFFEFERLLDPISNNFGHIHKFSVVASSLNLTFWLVV